MLILKAKFYYFLSESAKILSKLPCNQEKTRYFCVKNTPQQSSKWRLLKSPLPFFHANKPVGYGCNCQIVGKKKLTR